MRRVLVGLFLITCLLVLFTSQRQPQTAVAYNQDNLIRLHVVANSDLEEDQELKRQVRDVILRYLEPEVSQVKSRQEVKNLLENKLKVLEGLAQKHLQEAGRKDPVRAELGRFNFPARNYGDLVLPGGEYEAVRVVIGQGQGANWWCVLFPPLCFVDISWSLAENSDAREVMGLNSSGNPPRVFQFRFKILEILKGKSHLFSPLVTILQNGKKELP
ncbi:MAG TPA: stage II sporulation protein R [Clostridia bacterium]|nr:stage II sporulation protein R [Clostridia bacterium]